MTVIQFPTSGSGNRTCPVCGGQWWIVTAVCMDNDFHIGGFAGYPECYECAGGEVLRILERETP